MNLGSGHDDPISLSIGAGGLEQSEIDTIQELEQTSINESLLKYHDICIDEGINMNERDYQRKIHMMEKSLLELREHEQYQQSRVLFVTDELHLPFSAEEFDFFH